MNVNDFFDQLCSEHAEKPGFYLLNTDFNKIEINKNDIVFEPLRFLEVENIVRFLNPSLNITINSMPEENIESLEIDDFDSLVELLDTQSDVILKDRIIYNSYDQYALYFLPSHISRKITQITKNNQRKNIDYRLQTILPRQYIEELALKFDTEKEEEVIEYQLRYQNSVSFFKFYVDENTEANAEQTELKVNQLKYCIQPRYIESMDYFFIGNIIKEIGLLERNEKPHGHDPLHFHFNLWVLKNINLEVLYSRFILYPFNKEVLSNEL